MADDLYARALARLDSLKHGWYPETMDALKLLRALLLERQGLMFRDPSPDWQDRCVAAQAALREFGGPDV